MKTLTILLTLLFTLTLQASPERLLDAKESSADQVWEDLLDVQDGQTRYGKCFVQDASACKTCVCPYYFKSSVKGSLGHTGWPKNPQSGDSTGCLGGGCWGGYTSEMCTPNVRANAKAILLDAIKNGACGQ